MALGSRLRRIAVQKLALTAEAQVLRSMADLELLGWRRRLGVLGSVTRAAAPFLTIWRLLRCKDGPPVSPPTACP
ncbi:hypothetical protein [Desulfocurvibacter africanus]|uniref:hypothetical protein n=1 Tax=Desulfocurvibacter africanus TaxID=873 RepID=UPI00054D1B97|nr:hypothetical protein [Desulfocurvibacter africanus]